MSPREMSRSSSKRKVTAIGANASLSGPSKVSIEEIRVSSPLGSTTTASPGRKIPAAICPAWPR